jgi:hypothetical protein
VKPENNHLSDRVNPASNADLPRNLLLTTASDDAVDIDSLKNASAPEGARTSAW